MAGGLVAGGIAMAAPAVAGAQSDPIGPTVAQLEATYATAVANAQGTLGTVLVTVEDLVLEALNVGGLGVLLTNPGCLDSVLAGGIPVLGGGPPNPACL
jgi:hypothetical protein